MCAYALWLCGQCLRQHLWRLLSNVSRIAIVANGFWCVCFPQHAIEFSLLDDFRCVAEAIFG